MEMHGMSGSRPYRIWRHMLNRCYRTADDHYPDYGGRGISVCDEWRRSFSAFYEWASKNGYGDKLTIDRIDVNGNYEPSNCRWATMKQQQRNKRNSKKRRGSPHFITIDGETKTVTDWALCNGLKVNCIFARLSRGWSEKRAVETPCGTSRK